VLSHTVDTCDSSILVVVDNARSAEPLLAWSLIQACRRRVRLEVLYIPAFERAAHGCVLAQETIDQGRTELALTVDRLGARSCADIAVGDFEDSTAEAVRAKAMSGDYGLVMVGPVVANCVVKLIFGATQNDSDRDLGLPIVVVPTSAWDTVLPQQTPATVTVGFDGTDPATAALAWAVAEATRRDAVVRAVMAWSEGDHGGLGGPVALPGGGIARLDRSARRWATDSLAACGVPTNRVISVARRGMPASVLVQEAAESDLLAVGAGRSVVHGHHTLGAITLACLIHSPVPVAIVPGSWAR
jgi:nucleotide-binding universal stress UspA family protein